MTSIITNNGAMVALQTLQVVGGDLTKTQQQVSSGLRVAKASDNAAYWSIATTMRSDKGAITRYDFLLFPRIGVQRGRGPSLCPEKPIDFEMRQTSAPTDLAGKSRLSASGISKNYNSRHELATSNEYLIRRWFQNRRAY